MRSGRSRLIVVLFMVLLTVSATPPALAARPVSQSVPVHGIDIADMDLSVDPSVDFYRFANGGWLDRIEADGAYGAFNEVNKKTRDQLLTILNESAVSSDLVEGSDEWKAVQLFSQGIDQETRNAQGIDPIQPALDEIDAISNLDELYAYQQQAIFDGVTGLFLIIALTDRADSSKTAPYLFGPGYVLPNRDYYVENDDATKAVRKAYVSTSADLLGLAGYKYMAAHLAAQDVYDFEHALVEQTLTREEQQDPTNSYNPMSIVELKSRYPEIGWDVWLSELGLLDVDEIVVSDVRYFDALAGILDATPLAVIKDYLKLQLIWSFAEYLSSDFELEALEFNLETLYGVEGRRPLPARVLDQVNDMVGEATGKLYVETYFPPEAKAHIEVLVDELIVAFRQRLDENPWLTPATKLKAIDKLDHLDVKVGYPEEWHSYEAVEIADSYAMSAFGAFLVDYRESLEEVGLPIDSAEWDALPQEVNAQYDPLTNAITFPAAILQPPFFDFEADPASNFGGIGFIIGHEITHGFDLDGSSFNAEGDLIDWWTKEDHTAFQVLVDEVVTQYGAVEVLPGVFVDGQITVSENIADLGGLQIAFDGLQAYLKAHADPGVIDGFTQEQRFFISAATVWREEIESTALVTVVKTDAHAPNMVRPVQAMRNMDDFYLAFGIVAGDPMYVPPDKRLVIW